MMTITPDRPATRRRTVYDLPIDDSQWWLRGLCRDDSTAWQINDPHAAELTAPNRYAVRICRACPVRLDCLHAAARENDGHAVRGGMTPADRNAWLAEQGIPKSGKPQRKLGLGPRGPYRELDDDRLLSLHRAGVSQREIADELGCSKDTVCRRLAAARIQGLIA
jgi:hypothetical protein